MNNKNFCTLPVTGAQYIIGIEKKHDAGILLNYDDDDFSQAYGVDKQSFKSLTKDDILQPYIYTYLLIFSDFQMAGLMMLVIIYTFSTYNNSNFLQLLNQLN